MERLQGVNSLRAADTSGESSYCFGAASLIKKIRAVGSLKELNLVKACSDLKMICVLSYFVLGMDILKANAPPFFFGMIIFFFMFSVLIFSVLSYWLEPSNVCFLLLCLFTEAKSEY